jgi:hypothetical protein
MVGLFLSLLIDYGLCPRERRWGKWGRLVVGKTRSKKERWDPYPPWRTEISAQKS